MEEKKKVKGYKEGIVVSDKADKTIVVAIDTFKAHQKYLKRYLSTKKYKVHDPENKMKTGDKVRIVETKPKSRGKRWEVVY
jgi:small subunit ribosomal protein S17